jgi:hypothetical protein
MAERLEVVRARAAARARAVRLGDASSLGRDPLTAEIEKDYTRWLQLYYPRAVSKPMAFYHHELWQWTWLIELDQSHAEYDAFFGIWPRRCGKTTSGQLAIAAVGALKKRHYGWLLSRTQAQANQKLLTIRQAIGRMGSEYITAYPHMAKARTEDGQNLGWNTTRLICSDSRGSDFIVEAIGFDMAVRGANIDFQRPDFIMPDDVDSLHDSIHVTEKNIETFTKSILPAGTNDKVVLGLQNLIHRDSIFSQVADGRAKFLMNRFVSGPYPAIEGEFKYEERETLRGPRYFILSGNATWPEGFGLEACEKELNDSGPAAFESECQHNVTHVHEDSTFREFNPVYHCITVSEFMRYYVGNKAHSYNLRRLDVPFDKDGLAARLSLPRGDCAMAHDWGNNIKHPVALRWLWRPGEGVPLSDSVFFIREQCWPTFPTYPRLEDDPRATPSYRQVHVAILQVEKGLGLKSRWDSDVPCIQFRLNSHERPEAAVAYYRDHTDLESLMFDQIDTREAKEGILHLQELQHIDYDQAHPFRVDPRSVKDVPEHLCRICGWYHTGSHLKGRPRALYVVADGQGELYVDKFGKLAVKPAIDELGQARTRWEYPRHRPRETADGEEKGAAKKDDDIIDTDRALAGRVFYMIKRLSDKERLQLKYEEILAKVKGAAYPDYAARETAYMSVDLHHREEEEAIGQENKSWFQQLEGWEES